MPSLLGLYVGQLGVVAAHDGHHVHDVGVNVLILHDFSLWRSLS